MLFTITPFVSTRGSYLSNYKTDQMRKFIKVKSFSGFHIVSIDAIQYVSPSGASEYGKSVIKIPDYKLYCIESQEEIYNKINAAQR